MPPQESTHIHAKGLTSGKVAQIPVTVAATDAGAGDGNQSSGDQKGSNDQKNPGSNKDSDGKKAPSKNGASSGKGSPLAMTGAVSVLGLLALTAGGGALATAVRRRSTR